MIEKQKMLKAVSGSFLFMQDACDARFSSVVTDSRNVVVGSLFVPLMGEAQDGHNYIEQALLKGATVIFLDEAHKEAVYKKYSETDFASSVSFVVVKNTLLALQQLAHCYLGQFPKLIKIGITGSSGKTTTKEILGSLLSLKYNVRMNEGNLNSETGLPLSCFKITKEHEVGIFEAGMNRPGEMKELADVLNPDYALITNVGTAHIGILGSRQKIAEEKKSIFSNFTGKQFAFVSEVDDFKNFLSSDVNGTVKYFGTSATSSFLTSESRGLDGSLVAFKDGSSAMFALPGEYNLRNALGAIAIAEELGLTTEEICRGLESVKTIFGRSEIFKKESGLTLLQDCYNSNPDAVESALDFCNSVSWNGKRIYIIGSMLELGEESFCEHQKVGELLACSSCDVVLLFGEETKACLLSLKNTDKKVFQTSDINELLVFLKSEITDDSFIFVKGSRGMRLERISKSIFEDCDNE